MVATPTGTPIPIAILSAVSKPLGEADDVGLDVEVGVKEEDMREDEKEVV